MITEDEFAEIAGIADPALAFVRLETRFRKKLESKLESSENNEAYKSYVIEYINHTLAAARFLKLDILDTWEVPKHSSTTEMYNLYRDFTTEVDYYKVQIELAHLQQTKEFSVGLSTGDKERLRFYVEQIKGIIDEANLTPEKRDALFNKLNAFVAEVDRNRASWEKFCDMVIGISSVGGQAAEKLEVRSTGPSQHPMCR
jgi:hypothetical protein